MSQLLVLFNFFDEDDGWLQEMLLSLAPLCPDAVVAVDGAYQNFPGDEHLSPASNRRTIHRCCRALDARCFLTIPGCKWEGDEVAKRQELLDVALPMTTRDDWLYVTDSDYLLSRASGVREALESTDLDAAEVGFYEGYVNGEPWPYPARLLMRATPGMRMGRAHYLYELPDGRHHHILGRDSDVPALDLTGNMLVHHRVHERSTERRARQAAYYEVRDRGNLEG